MALIIFLTLTDTRLSIPGGRPLRERLKLYPPCRQLIVTETQLKEKMEMGTGSVKTNSKQNYEIKILVHDDDKDHTKSNIYICLDHVNSSM